MHDGTSWYSFKLADSKKAFMKRKIDLNVEILLQFYVFSNPDLLYISAVIYTGGRIVVEADSRSFFK